LSSVAFSGLYTAFLTVHADHTATRLNTPTIYFLDGVGVFEGDDEPDGKPIRVRYTWSDITLSTARWSQAMSADDGQTWETNWVMEHVRVEG